jgi:plasmid stability protein
MTALRRLRAAALRHVAILTDELRDLLGQIVEVENGHVTLNIDSDTWRNVAAQSLSLAAAYGTALLAALIIVVLIRLALTQ